MLIWPGVDGKRKQKTEQSEQDAGKWTVISSRKIICYDKITSIAREINNISGISHHLEITGDVRVRRWKRQAEDNIIRKAHRTLLRHRTDREDTINMSVLFLKNRRTSVLFNFMV